MSILMEKWSKLSTINLTTIGALVFATISTKGLQNDSFFDFTINQPGCQIPHFDRFSPEVLKFYCNRSNLQDLDCDGHLSPNFRPLLLIDEGNFLRLDISALPYYQSNGVRCQYRSFYRNNSSKDGVWYSKAKLLDLDQPHKMDEEFVEVECYDTITFNLTYRDYFAFLPRKNETERRCEAYAKNTDSISVLIIGLDSLSRLQFHRQLNSSSWFLNNRMGAIEMRGYNKVGENTYSNLVPLLTGLDQYQLYDLCLKDTGQIVDTCPLIFNKFHKNGFRTIFVEDAPDLAIFNYGASGFNEQPTDYYLRPMYLEYERRAGTKTFGCGNACLGSRSSLEFLLNYARKTAQTFARDKYFAFLWSCCCTHDSFNFVPHVDETVFEFLNDLHHNNDILNNTVLIVMADHGPRMIPEFKQTIQGQYEKRLPLLSFVFPPWFERKYSEAVTNLRINSERLSTHFDLHRTLYDFIDLRNIEKFALLRRYKSRSNLLSQGTSLFLPIPSDRTCLAANIPAEFCTCNGQTVFIQ